MITRSTLVAVAVMLALSGAAAGEPSWNAPVQLSFGDRALAPELALNAGGEALVVWDQEVGAVCSSQPAALECIHIVTAATRPRGSTTWHAPIEISRPGVDSRPTAAIGGSGDAAITWVHDIGRDRVVQATYRRGPSGTWPEPNDLSEPRLEIREHEVGVDAAGNVVAVWSERAQATFAVKAAVRSATSGVWGTAVTLSSSQVTASAGPSLAIAENGEAIVAWVESGSRVRVARGDASTGAWTSPVELSRSSWPVDGTPDVALNAAGDAAVAWAQRATGEGRQRAQVSYRPRGAGWETPRSLQPGHDGDPREPAIALDRAGNGVVIWLSSGAVETAARAAGTGVWDGQRVIAYPDERARDARLAIDSAGNTVAAWRNDEIGSVRAALKPGASGAWQPPATISSTGATPRIALAASGSGLAVWNESTADSVVVDGSRLDGTGPVLQLLRAPRRMRLRGRGAFSVRPVPWATPLAGLPRWTFGDGGSAIGVRTTHAYARFGRFTVSVTQRDAAGGSATRTRTVVVGAPRLVSRPSIAGNVRFGATLTCLPGTWVGARPLRFAYQWLRDTFVIRGATASRYRIRVRDLQESLGCRVRATNALGATVARARPVYVTVGG